MNNALKLLSFLLILQSCSKEEITNDKVFTQDPTLVESNQYFPLKIGNYWIYKVSTFTGDTMFELSKPDTLIVDRDSVISNQSYFVLKRKLPEPGTTWYLRDSSGFLITPSGQVFLSKEPSSSDFNAHYNFNGPDGDTLYHYYDRFQRTTPYTVPAGSFVCLEKLTYHDLLIEPKTKVIDTLYFSPIGPIRLSYSYSSGSYVVAELSSYHLE